MSNMPILMLVAWLTTYSVGAQTIEIRGNPQLSSEEVQGSPQLSPLPKIKVDRSGNTCHPDCYVAIGAGLGYCGLNGHAWSKRTMTKDEGHCLYLALKGMGHLGCYSCSTFDF